jgi:hypothetical protein
MQRENLIRWWAVPSGIKWSPMIKWLAYSIEDLYFNEEVFIHPSDNSSKPVNISMHPEKIQIHLSADGQNSVSFLPEVLKMVYLVFAYKRRLVCLVEEDDGKKKQIGRIKTTVEKKDEKQK